MQEKLEHIIIGMILPGSQGTTKDSYLIENLGSRVTSMNVSPFQTQSSTLYVGNEVGQLITNAQNPNQTKEQINGDEFYTYF